MRQNWKKYFIFTYVKFLPIPTDFKRQLLKKKDKDKIIFKRIIEEKNNKFCVSAGTINIIRNIDE